MAIHQKALPGIGQEILGIDANQEISAETAEKLREIWNEAGVLLFRDVGTSPETLLRLSRCFGELEPHPLENIRHPTYPELIVLSNKERLMGPVYSFDGVPTYNRIPWHTDLAFKLVPNAGALLNMVEKSPVGGQTAWLDTALAYESFDDALKQRLEGVEAQFEFCTDLSGMRFNNPGGTRIGESKMNFPDYAPIARPIIWSHPVTGRTILNVCPLNIRNIVGMSEAEGDELIQTLIDAVLKPEFTYEHEWTNGDIILWDNYRMMHRAMGHPVDVVRVVHRTTLRGHATVGRSLETADVKAVA